MSDSNLIATIGVSMLLLAFFLNLFRFLKQESWFFLLLNFLGAGLSCYASYLINFLPFIILEGTWGLVALGGMIKKIAVSQKNSELIS
jgi:hypothetical protein